MKLKKGDIIVIIVSAVLLLVSVFIGLAIKKDGKTVKIYEDNKLIYEGSLTKQKTVKLAHNTVNIEDGEVCMKKSDCKNQICVHKGKISNSRECIVCLPNKVIIEIE